MELLAIEEYPLMPVNTENTFVTFQTRKKCEHCIKVLLNRQRDNNVCQYLAVVALLFLYIQYIRDENS